MCQMSVELFTPCASFCSLYLRIVNVVVRSRGTDAIQVQLAAADCCSRRRSSRGGTIPGTHCLVTFCHLLPGHETQAKFPQLKQCLFKHTCMCKTGNPPCTNHVLFQLQGHQDKKKLHLYVTSATHQPHPAHSRCCRCSTPRSKPSLHYTSF